MPGAGDFFFQIALSISVRSIIMHFFKTVYSMTKITKSNVLEGKFDVIIFRFMLTSHNTLIYFASISSSHLIIKKKS